MQSCPDHDSFLTFVQFQCKVCFCLQYVTHYSGKLLISAGDIFQRHLFINIQRGAVKLHHARFSTSSTHQARRRWNSSGFRSRESTDGWGSTDTAENSAPWVTPGSETCVTLDKLASKFVCAWRITGQITKKGNLLSFLCGSCWHTGWAKPHSGEKNTVLYPSGWEEAE